MASSITVPLGLRVPTPFYQISEDAARHAGFNNRSELCMHFLRPWLEMVAEIMEKPSSEEWVEKMGLQIFHENLEVLGKIQENQTKQLRLPM